jgi:type I restriction enzyme S subunit
MKDGWEIEELGKLFHTTSGGTPSRKNAKYYQGTIPWVKSGELDKGIIYDTEEKISDEAIKNSSAKIFPKGTLLIALYGATIGKLAFLGVEASTNQAICGIFQSDAVNSNYLYNFLLFKRPKLISQGTGGAQPNISQTILKKLEIPLAPLPIQRAIVSKIESLFSDLDKGIADLKKAQEQLKIYRQAVLKKAFEGELTKAWREKQTNLPIAEEFLERIKQEQHKWIETEISKGNNEAKRIKTKLKKSTFKPSNEGLPNQWSWATFIHSCLFVIDCHNKTAPYEDDGIYLVRTTNIRNGKLDLENKIKYVSEDTYQYWSRRAFPNTNDIIFTREAPMGEAAIIPKDTKICLGQRTMLLRTIPDLLENKYLLYNILSEVFQQRMRDGAIGTGVKHLRVGDVENLSFPLCPNQEQHQIVREIESRLSVCDKIEQSITEALHKSEALRQSILKKAFEGKLLSETEIAQCKQEADYEPASVLLARIERSRNEKERHGK